MGKQYWLKELVPNEVIAVEFCRAVERTPALQAAIKEVGIKYKIKNGFSPEEANIVVLIVESRN